MMLVLLFIMNTISKVCTLVADDEMLLCFVMNQTREHCVMLKISYLIGHVALASDELSIKDTELVRFRRLLLQKHHSLCCVSV